MAKTVVAAVRRDLSDIAKADPKLAQSSLAATALALAGELDDQHNSATSKSMCAGRLLEAMTLLRDLTPEGDQQDGIDDLSARRAKRRAGGSAA